LARGGWRVLLLVLLAGLGVNVAGCGEEGAAGGATVTVYVSAPLRGEEAGAGRRLCDEAREQAGQGKGDDEDLKLQVECLDAAGPKGEWTLAQVGANARLATEDSTAVAYIGEPDPQARKQSHPILDAAGIAQVGNGSGREAIARIQSALRDSDQSDPRAAIFDALG
jgi:hypothetical protein